MSTVIGVTGRDLLLPSLDQYTAAAVVLPAPAEQPLEAALTDAWAAVEAVGHLVVAVPAWLPAEHRRRLYAVRALLESDRIALVEVDLPPLGTALLAQQLRQLAPYDLGPGVIASAAPLLAHYLYAGAVLGSVARLDRVPIGLAAHLKSWVPGVQFAVLARPEPQLVEAGGAARLPGPDYPTDLAVAGQGPGADWPRTRLCPDWNCRQVRDLPPLSDAARWWGSAKTVEFAAHIADVSVLYRLVSSAHREACRWCGRDRVGEHCGFCGPAPGAPPPAGTGGRARGIALPHRERRRRTG